jgi:hypothetical protein
MFTIYAEDNKVCIVIVLMCDFFVIYLGRSSVFRLPWPVPGSLSRVGGHASQLSGDWVRPLRSGQQSAAQLQVHTSDTQYSTTACMLVTASTQQSTGRGTVTGTHK